MSQAPLLDVPAVVTAVDLEREAMSVFQEMLEGGCSLTDAITAVYTAGVERSAPGTTEKRPKKRSVPPCPYKDIYAAYHRILPELPSVRLMDDPDRRRAMQKVWKWVFESKKSDGTQRATTAAEGLTWIENYFQRASENAFLMAREGRHGEHKNWKCDLDYLMTSRGMKTVIERT